MKNASLMAAAGILAAANAVLLVHVLRNRLGTPDADITLTSRELRYYPPSASDENSGITLQLWWTDLSTLPVPGQSPPDWLGRPLLEKLGFDCGMDPSAADAGRFYQRQRPRQGYVALEFEGPEWRAWLEASRQPGSPYKDPARYVSHLVAVDADADPRPLRARHPDRASVIVVPAVIAIVNQDPLAGRIQEIPTSIHVPLPSSEYFRPHFGQPWSNRWSAHVRYGALLEPWIVDMQFE